MAITKAEFCKVPKKRKAKAKPVVPSKARMMVEMTTALPVVEPEKIETLYLEPAPACPVPEPSLPIEEPVERSAVAQLLTESMALHNRARQAGRPPTRPQNWRDMLSQAYALRKAALSQDPDRRDDAWGREDSHTAVGRNTHDALMAFYGSLGLS